jgi:hypothetical protein
MVQRFRAEDSGSCQLKLAHCKSQGPSLTGQFSDNPTAKGQSRHFDRPSLSPNHIIVEYLLEQYDDTVEELGLLQLLERHTVH